MIPPLLRLCHRASVRATLPVFMPNPRCRTGGWREDPADGKENRGLARSRMRKRVSADLVAG